MRETWVRSLRWEDPLKKEMATHSCLENPMDRGAWQAAVHGGHKESDTTEQLHFSLAVNQDAASYFFPFLWQ